MQHDPAKAIATLGTPSPDAVRVLEAAMLQQPQVIVPIEHSAFGGMSIRRADIPAGTALTGALTKRDNVCIVIGDITVTTDEGPQRLTGIHVLPAKAGAKRIGVTHTDTVWITVHRTDLTDIAAIEAEMTDEAPNLQTRALGVD